LARLAARVTSTVATRLVINEVAGARYPRTASVSGSSTITFTSADESA
jgi:hypothetical protein